MMYHSLLDDFSGLSNYKNRYGLNVQAARSTSIYLKQRKLQKFLDSMLLDFISDKMDRNKYIDWIVFKCDNHEIIEKVDYLFTYETKMIVDMMLKNLKVFWKFVKKYDI